jgi:hypothetical protein
VRIPTVLVAALASAVLVLFTAWLFELPLEQVAVLAPVVVVAFGAAAFLAVVWTKVILESLRRRRPRA